MTTSSALGSDLVGSIAARCFSGSGAACALESRQNAIRLLLAVCKDYLRWGVVVHEHRPSFED